MAHIIEAIAALHKFVARINAHDPRGIIALCTADHVFIDSLGSRLSGRQRLEQAWTGYFSLFPDYRIEVESAASQDTLALACGFATGTHPASKDLAHPCCMACHRERRADCRVAGLRR